MPRSFKLLKTLGEGAFGSVHLAEVRGEADLVQTLAVKWLHPQWSRDAELAGRLRDEARLLALLSHENIVQVHGLTHIDGRLAILMEPIDGVDLSDLDDSLPSRVAVEIVEAVADALSAAYEATPPGQDAALRVVHRDIKPSNIMVTVRGGVKVMDFGVARASFASREAQTQSQQYGTARYMAPERWLHGVAEAPSDVFSLGVTLIELLTGPVERPRLSRQGFEEDLGAAVGRVTDPDLRDLLGRMCAFDPEQRPSAAQVREICSTLADALEGPALKRWAEAWVPLQKQHRPAPPTGDTVVVEDQSGEAYTVDLTHPAPTAALSSPAPAVAPVWFWSVYAGLTLVLFGVPCLGLVSLAIPPESPPQASIPTADPQLTLPEPAPPPMERLPTPALEPTATPQPSPSPAPSPRPRAVPAPQPASPAEPSPPPVEAPAQTQVVFILEPADLVASTPEGRVHNRRAIDVVANANVSITVGTGAEQWQCTVPIESSPSTWRIKSLEAGRGSCTREG